MKKHLNYVFPILFCCALFIQVPSLWAMCSTTVLWHNLSDGSSFKSGITADVIDQNIDIQGINALVDGIHVNAQTCDILITVTDNDAIITGSGNRSDGVPTNPARLYLFAATGRTITFSLTNDLLFRGTADHGINLDLLVSVSGGGEVIFDILGNKKVLFTSLPTTGGTLLALGMNDTPNDASLIFRRLPADPVSNIEVVVGARSCITYIAGTGSVSSTEIGNIAFEPSNAGTGLTIMRLQNNSCFVIWGHLLTAAGGLNNPNFLISDIDFDVPAGQQAQLMINNPYSAQEVPSSLQIINENTILTNFAVDPFCDNAFTGTQKGFVLGAYGQLQLNDITYIEYIGTTTNSIPVVNTPTSNLKPTIVNQIVCGQVTGAQDFIKERNASAFMVDGLNDPTAIPAQITMNGSSAIYFMSGVNCVGEVSENFIIEPGQETTGVGNIVFDVEGVLNINGDPAGNNALNVLSLQVTQTGCSVFVESNETQFPQRTFARDSDGKYLQYNRGAWLINNRMNINNASIIHSDEIHNVYQQQNLGRCDLSSEPTYIGGETFFICATKDERPLMAFYDSFIRVNTNIGMTGFDLRVPNNPNAANDSIFRFYNNGRAIDKGYGRVMILGTNIGAYSAGGQLIDNNTYLDVFQEIPQATITPQMLSLDVSANDSCITQGITSAESIIGQCAVHSIFLNNASNIQVGTNGTQGIDENTGLPFDLVTTPSLCINGAFFSFDTAGGNWCLPEGGATTGQGALFVDTNGTVKIQPYLRASFSMMVARSRNGMINLPKDQVYFTPRVGIAQSTVNLQDADQQVLVRADENFSDYTMDWGSIEKDYTSSNSLVPYEPKMTPAGCSCPPVTNENLRSLPQVFGKVQEFQIKRSRIGDQFQLQVAGGIINQLTLLLGNNPAEFPGGFLVVQDNAVVGINTNHRTPDSLSALIQLGINGLLICANGDATINLNEDVFVNNVCPILTGTSFGVLAPQTLTIYAHEEREFRIKSTGVLDLSQFNNQNKIIRFAGKVRLVCEPGAKIVLGGGTLTFTDQAVWTFERVLDEDKFAGTLPKDLDAIRAKLVGTGFVVFEEDASFNLLQDQFFGIESNLGCDVLTSVTWILHDRASIEIGRDGEPGGAFQIGNTICDPLASVNFTLILDGNGTNFTIDSEGFLGLGVGIADKASNIPNLWLVNCLNNVSTISIDVRVGTFDHRRISTGDSSVASLLAIGESGSYTFAYDLINATIRGGGNMVLISACLDNTCDQVIRSEEEEFAHLNKDARTIILQAKEMIKMAEERIEKARELIQSMPRSLEKAQTITRKAIGLIHESKNLKKKARDYVRNVIIPSINPIVQTTNGEISENLTVGIMGGKYVWNGARNRTIQPANASGTTLFSYLVTDNYNTFLSPRANIAGNIINQPLISFVDLNVIRRQVVFFILGVGGFNESDFSYSLSLGAVGINLDDASRAIVRITELRGAP